MVTERHRRAEWPKRELDVSREVDRRRSNSCDPARNEQPETTALAEYGRTLVVS